MFNHTTLEADIERLSREVAERRKTPEHRNLADKEIVSRILEPAIKNQSAPASPAAANASADDNQILPDYLKAAPQEVKLQVEELVDAVFHQGLEAAVSRARSIKNLFILDAFHDALTDKLYEELKRRNLL